MQRKALTERLSRTLTRWFPVPKTLLPSAAGVDISDTSIKWILLEGSGRERRVRSHGQEPLSQGVVVNGLVQNLPALAEALSAVKHKLGEITCAHAAFPEEAAYVFGMHVPENSSREQILSMIEFELEGRVPIPPSAAIYDFDFIGESERASDEIGVVVFPREVAESYAAAFSAAGFHLLSLDVEARSTARAVASEAPESVVLLVDIGRLRTGFAVLKRGIPIFTSTVGVRGDTVDKVLAEKLSLSSEEIAKFKNEEGLLAEAKGSLGLEAIAGATAALADEVARHYRYWDTRRNERGEQVTPVERVLLVGGSANLKGLGDFLAARVQAECERPNVWENVCSFDDYIPPINRQISLTYATAVGLALRGA